MEWSSESNIDLINLYHAKPELWDVGTAMYKNIKMKRGAIDEIAAHFHCSPEDINTKLSIMRAKFHREHSKVLQKRAAGTGKMYVPKWYAYDLLQFLGPSETPKTSKRKLQNTPGAEGPELTPAGPPNNVDITKDEATPALVIHSDNSDDSELEVIEVVGFDKVPPPEEPPVTKCRKITERKTPKGGMAKRASKMAEQLVVAGAGHGQVQDDFSTFADYISSTLRGLPSKYLQCRARHQISNILFQVESESYCADLSDPPTPQEQTVDSPPSPPLNNFLARSNCSKTNNAHDPLDK